MTRYLHVDAVSSDCVSLVIVAPDADADEAVGEIEVRLTGERIALEVRRSDEAATGPVELVVR